MLTLPPTQRQPTLAWAADELARFLGGHVPPFDLAIRLVVDAALGYAHELRRDGAVLTLAGGSPTAVLHAVYTLLERLGWRFDLACPVQPAAPRWDGLPTATERITPAIPRRGIRQHLNFPMDLSAWSLEDACDYVRNLARLRFTHLTVHSYPGQWIACRMQGGDQRAGGFFYGEEHPVGGAPWLRRLVGQRRWCIPGAEPLLDDIEARSDYARAWLRGLIAEATRVGLQVSFSFEPRRNDADLSDTLAQAEAILADYPGIDRLELMIEEAGEEGERLDPAELRARLGAIVPPASLDEPSVAALIGQRAPGLVKTLGQTAHNVRALAALRERLGGRVGLDLGIYNVAPRIARGLVGLWRAAAPADTGLALLCGHGASRIARHLPQIGLRPDEYARTMIYAWVEFDGLMYFQQDDAEGLATSVEQILILGTTPPGLAVNHWRVAENAWAIRYMAELGLAGRVAPRDYRWQAACALGISEPARVRLGLAALAALTDSMYDLLPNAAFSFYGCWYPDSPTLGSLGWQRPEHLLLAAEQYAAIRAVLAPCQASTEPGAAWLGLLRNRLEWSERYLRALVTARSLLDVLDPQGHPRPGQHIEALRRCDLALAEMEAVLAGMAALAPDRSTLGTLVSMDRVVVRFVRHHRDRLAGDVQQSVVAGGGAGHDAPPPPALGG